MKKSSSREFTLKCMRAVRNELSVAKLWTKKLLDKGNANDEIKKSQEKSVYDYQAYDISNESLPLPVVDPVILERTPVSQTPIYDQFMKGRPVYSTPVSYNPSTLGPEARQLKELCDQAFVCDWKPEDFST
ncbi:hypothetical protein BDB01DRAFT_777271 [Pilobolus umbonatus]|nr:hypothetical protein BDB01DRAFT_777271 [Pilobolus umbonatus]